MGEKIIYKNHCTPQEQGDYHTSTDRWYLDSDVGRKLSGVCESRAGNIIYGSGTWSTNVTLTNTMFIYVKNTDPLDSSDFLLLNVGGMGSIIKLMPGESFASEVGASFAGSGSVVIEGSGTPTYEYIQGKYSKYSIEFDGNTDWVDLRNVDFGVGEYTISAWINKSGTGAETLVDNTNNADDKELSFDLTASNKLHIYLKGGGATANVWGQTTLSADTWYHVVATRDGSNVNRIYVNGTVEGTNTSGAPESEHPVTSSIDASGEQARLGAYNDGGANGFDGYMYEVAIFNEGKTALEIQAIYNSGQPWNLSNEDGLIGYWRMREGSGSFIEDDSGNRNTGHFQNNVAWSTEVK